MFIYLSKKISIPDNATINNVCWSSQNGWIAIGGENGILKILKLGNDKSNKQSNGTSKLSVNQTLEGHSGDVRVLAWNEQHEKLTSTDDNGLIIVWMLHKGTWHEEMINNRNKSLVKDVAWNCNGQKICIVYEDGAVIVGSADGNRIWSKEFKKQVLTNVQWSPDSKYILFGNKSGDVNLHDDLGNFLVKINIVCLPTENIIVQIAKIHWYFRNNTEVPSLAIAYESGHIQIMRNPYDTDSIILDTSLLTTCCRWNHKGDILAVAGSVVLTGDTNNSNVVQFYTPYGQHLRTLKLPGNNLIPSISWEGNSLRLVIPIESNIYFASIRPNYQWCYFSNTILYTYNGDLNTTVVFWDIKANKIYKKNVERIISVTSWKEHCILAAPSNDVTGKYILMLCNNLTTVVDNKYTNLKPLWTCMNETHVFAASENSFIMWHYVTPQSRSLSFRGSRHRKDGVYHVDDTPSGVAELIEDLDKDSNLRFFKATKDPICCTNCCNKILLIARKSGIVQIYSLPQVALVQRINLNNTPWKLALNSDSTIMSTIDTNGVLTLTTINKNKSQQDDNNDNSNRNRNSEEIRRDVWDMKWASDNPELLAVMEKSRMYILRRNIPEEPINSYSYIASFKDLEVKTVSMDNVMENPENPKIEFVDNIEVKSLRDTRQLIQKVGLKEAISFVENNPHDRLWKILAEEAINNLNLTDGESAYVRCSDYSGLQLIKRLANIQNVELKKAVIAAYYGKYDEAENLYLKADRRDLAIKLREKLGDWFRVIELMKMGSNTSDSQLTRAWSEIGNYFYERSNWQSAKEYYTKSGDYNKLINCYQLLEEYDSLESCIPLLPEKHALLQKIAEIFATVGMCPQAVACYIKLGAYEKAAEVCMQLNEWGKAIELTKSYPINTDVNLLIDKKAIEYMEKGNILQVIQLYKKAQRFTDAALLLYRVANDKKEEKTSAIILKKIYVLVAMLIEEQIKYNKNNNRLNSAGGRSKAVVGITMEPIKNMKLLDDPWHPAEAYHFYLLAQNQLTRGDTIKGLTCAMTLKRYENILPKEQIYCIIALAALAAGAYDSASRAFMELESIESTKVNYGNIAISLFSNHVPVDPPEMKRQCSNCLTLLELWDVKCTNCDIKSILCVICGEPIDNMADSWQCQLCKHSTHYNEIVARKTCALCHSPI